MRDWRGELMWETDLGKWFEGLMCVDNVSHILRTDVGGSCIWLTWLPDVVEENDYMLLGSGGTA